jgi:hypothetical protein
MTAAVSPRSIKQVIFDGLGLFKNSLLEMQVINLGTLLLVAPLAGAFTLFMGIESNAAHRVSLSAVGTLICFLMAFSSITLIQSIIFHSLNQFRQTRTISFKKALVFCFLRLHYILLGALFYGLSVIAGTILFIIPGIILAILFMYILPCILFENKDAFTCLTSSARIVWPYWFRTAFIVILANAMGFIILFLLSLCTGLTTGLLGSIVAPQATSTIGILFQGIGFLFYAVLQLMIFSMIFAVILEQYYDLKARQAMRVSPDN